MVYYKYYYMFLLINIIDNISEYCCDGKSCRSFEYFKRKCQKGLKLVHYTGLIGLYYLVTRPGS